MPQLYGCPECSSVEDFEQYDLIPGRAQISHFDANGEPEWEGSTEIDWDDSIPDPSVACRYHCLSCGADFHDPVLVEVEEDVEVDCPVIPIDTNRE